MEEMYTVTNNCCKTVQSYPPYKDDGSSQDLMYDAQSYTGAEDFPVQTRSKQSQDDSVYTQTDGESSRVAGKKKNAKTLSTTTGKICGQL